MNGNWKFHITLYHGGRLTHEPPPTKYDGGDVVIIGDCDPRTWGLGYLEARAHGVGIKIIHNFIWNAPGSDLATGCKLLSSAADFNELINCIGNEAFVDVYVEHTCLPILEEEVINVQEEVEEEDVEEEEVYGRDYDDVEFEAGYARLLGYENNRGPGDSDEDYASPQDSDNEVAPVLISFKENSGLDDPFTENMVFIDTNQLL